MKEKEFKLVKKEKEETRQLKNTHNRIIMSKRIPLNFSSINGQMKLNNFLVQKKDVDIMVVQDEIGNINLCQYHKKRKHTTKKMLDF